MTPGFSFGLGLIAYLFLIFVRVLPRLYAASVQINDVRPGLDGQHCGQRLSGSID